MKALLPLFLASFALTLVSCTSPIVKRIERNPEIYNALTPHQKDLVQQGRVEEGMTKKAVFLAWGRPDGVSKGSRQGSTYEKWSYAGYQPTYANSMGFAVGVNQWSARAYHRGSFTYDRSFFYEPTMVYLPYEAARVEFLNDIVTAWSVNR